MSPHWPNPDPGKDADTRIDNAGRRCLACNCGTPELENYYEAPSAHNAPCCKVGYRIKNNRIKNIGN